MSSDGAIVYTAIAVEGFVCGPSKGEVVIVVQLYFMQEKCDLCASVGCEMLEHLGGF